MEPQQVRVLEFMMKFNPLAVANKPTIPDDQYVELSIKLIEEELQEFKEAWEDAYFVKIADALSDLNYVVHFAANVFGIDLEEIDKEVHRSNMTKLGEDGEPIFNEIGKICKGPNYEPPRITEILERQRKR